MTNTDPAHAEAVAWLVGRLRFEHLLTDLQRRADAAGGPVELAVPALTAQRAA